MSKENVIAQLASDFGISRADVAADYTNLLVRWADYHYKNGLIGDYLLSALMAILVGLVVFFGIKIILDCVKMDKRIETSLLIVAVVVGMGLGFWMLLNDLHAGYEADKVQWAIEKMQQIWLRY